ncbi:MAG: hypothetical protein IJ209_08360 [Bacteroidaceae bacterium]|nr:hypothetical protein [Bacteroidaceae bacterium]
MVKLLLLTLAFVAIAVAFLAAKLLLKGDTRGPMTHIGASKPMRERGIHCVESMDSIERFQLAHKPHAKERIRR